MLVGLINHLNSHKITVGLETLLDCIQSLTTCSYVLFVCCAATDGQVDPGWSEQPVESRQQFRQFYRVPAPPL